MRGTKHTSNVRGFGVRPACLVVEPTKFNTIFFGYFKEHGIKLTKEEKMSKREKESNSYRIWRSNVVVNNPKHVFCFRRKWNCLDRGNVILIAGLHVMALFAPFAFDWGALWATIILNLVTGLLGITVSYHRNLAHRSFKLPKWLEYFLAYCGLLALQVRLF